MLGSEEMLGTPPKSILDIGKSQIVAAKVVLRAMMPFCTCKRSTRGISQNVPNLIASRAQGLARVGSFSQSVMPTKICILRGIKSPGLLLAFFRTWWPDIRVTVRAHAKRRRKGSLTMSNIRPYGGFPELGVPYWGSP